MRSAPRPRSFAFAAYLVMLLGFLFLGLFVMSLAGGVDAPSWMFGLTMAVLFAGALTAFRMQIRLSEATRDSDVYVSSDPLTPPLRRTDVEQYERTYRRVPAATAETPHTNEGTRLYKAA
ncbi:hypothetical protein [Gordonia sp. GN26]